MKRLEIKGISFAELTLHVGLGTFRSIDVEDLSSGLLKPAEGWTNKFIFPPYDFSLPDAMVTNFHMPKSSLLIMVCAFGGYELIMDAYKKAIKDKYRFYTYGDAMLII